MKASVLAAFVPFTARFEGVVPFMYLDVKGLVTTAIGNLIDPVESAVHVPFVVPSDGGRRATQAEIRAEWETVKRHPTAAKLGHRALINVTKLRLTDEGIRALVYGKLGEMERKLARRFPEWDEWPADAQLATLSMAWACGPGFRFPKLEALLLAREFFEAVGECRIREHGNPGIVPRNDANRVLYSNAGVVQSCKLDPEELHWPKALTNDRPTERELEAAPPASSSPAA